MERMKEYNITGMDEAPNTTDPDNYIFVLDKSGSMDYYEDQVRHCLENYKAELSSIDEASAISVARFDFNEACSTNDKKFTNITNMNTSYIACGGTDLYSAIVKTVQFALDTYESLMENAYDPRMTYIIISDGEHNNDGQYSMDEAKEMVEKAAACGITMVFVDFGSSNGNIPRKLGFQTIYSCENSSEALQKTFKAITSSCIRQSQSKIVNPEDWM